MIPYYFKIAWRSLLKQKMYSVINIGGLALGIAACILISLFITHELSFDKSYPDGERIYRIVGEHNMNTEPIKGAAMPAPLIKAIKDDFPEVELAGRLLPNALFGAGSHQVSTDQSSESSYEEGFTFIDQELIDMLQVPMEQGSRVGALDRPNTMIISESKAEKYYPGLNPVGKVLYLNNDKSRPFTITGVMKDIPLSSHLRSYNFFLTLSGVEFYEGEQSAWNASNYVSYVRLKEGTDYKLFEQKLSAGILKNHLVPSLLKSGSQDAEKLIKSSRLLLQPISSIHLHSSDIHDYMSVPRGDIRFIWLFASVATFILLIACINFVNLSTARSASRAKEVGVRKVVGSRRKALLLQFLVETILYSFISFFVGLLLAWLLLPVFNELAGKELALPWAKGWFILLILFSATVVGLLAGIYPAFVLSSFKPDRVLRGNVGNGPKNPLIRSGLVVFQFTTSIILILSTLVIYSQMQFVLNQQIGYNKEQVLLLHGTNTLGNKVNTLKDELNKLPQISHVSVGDYLPIRASGVKRNGNVFSKTSSGASKDEFSGQRWEIDEDYIQVMGMEIVQGRNFSAEIASDSSAMIINETMAKAIGSGTVVGKQIFNGAPYTIIGVVRDFNFESLEGKIEGVAMVLGDSPSMISVKLSGKDMPQTIESITQIWKSFSPEQSIRYSFLDEGYANMYKGLQRMSYIFTCFAFLAIIIACLGLLGLSAFATFQRTKEVGIRKVLGATVMGIVKMLSVDFIKLVLIAVLIASPIAWWAMNRWLEDFAYRVNIQWWMFVGAGIIAVLIALFTVSFQAVKAAVANPVDSLRDE